jgi:hypothetical protein
MQSVGQFGPDEDARQLCSAILGDLGEHLSEGMQFILRRAIEAGLAEAKPATPLKRLSLYYDGDDDWVRFAFLYPFEFAQRNRNTIIMTQTSTRHQQNASKRPHLGLHARRQDTAVIAPASAYAKSGR